MTTPKNFPEGLLERCIIEPFNGHDEDDGVYLTILRSDDLSKVDTYVGRLHSYEAALEWAAKAYRRGELTA